MNWPTALTICVCAICATLLGIGALSNRKKSDDE